MILPFEHLSAYPGALAWFLLGSANTETMRPDSDIDLALLLYPEASLDREALIRWSASLSLILGREVDAGVIDHRNLVYAKEALLTGRRVFCADEKLANRRGSELLALYLKFQEDRKEVVDAYRA